MMIGAARVVVSVGMSVRMQIGRFGGDGGRSGGGRDVRRLI